MYYRFSVLFPLLLLGSSLSRVSLAQEPRKDTHTLSRAATAAAQQPLVDGAKTPGNIPDELALKILFMTLASQEEESIVRAKLAPLALTSADLAQIRVQVVAFRAEFVRYRDKLASMRRTLSGPAAVQAVGEIDQSIMTLVSRTHTQTLESLTSDGKTKFAKH